MKTPKIQLIGDFGGTSTSTGSTHVGTTQPEDEKYTLWVDTSGTPALVKYKDKNGNWVVTGGSGGGDTSEVVLKLLNLTGWLYKTVSCGGDCELSFSWSSIQDGIATGKGMLKLDVNGKTKTSREIAQGNTAIKVGSYLVSGSNEVEVTIIDIYGNSKSIKYTIEAVSLALTSYFDATTAYTGDISFSYTPIGAVEKTVHFLVDNEEVGSQTVMVSNREQTFTIPAQAHGSHKLEVYFTGMIGDEPIESNHLFYDLICYVEGDETPIITTPFNTTTVVQYSTVVIPYVVYTPLLTSEIQLKDGNNLVSTLTVDRTKQIWSYRAKNHGVVNLSITCGDVTKDISFEVTKNEIGATAETNNLELYLTSEGRSNNEQNPLVWSYGDVNAELTGFNLTSDGWKNDDDGNVVLRVSGDARVHVPFSIFASDFRTSGKTIEIELATRDVLNYDAVVLSSWSNDRGIQITAQKALLKSEQSEIFTQYKEDEHIRIAFCVEKRAENRLLSIYINGIMSGVVQYPDDDDFSQTSPVGITIGSNECTTDIYCIRVYNTNLSRYQILDNWIADTQDVNTMMDRYMRNEIFDAYGNISIDKLPAYIPYLVIDASAYTSLPQSKGDKKIVSGEYIDPLHEERSFTFENAEIDVQGTSSQYYSRKNYKIKFNGGFVVNGVSQPTYKLRDTSMPTDVFTFKADVASSEGANNVELVMFYDDTCPVKTPPQENDSRVRQGIEGYPCVIFYYDGLNYNFLGKYNFNNDKSTEEVFGFESGTESWEILQNNTEMVIWKDDNFEGDGWKTSFEARYPEDSTNVTNLKSFSTWLKSTDTTVVDTEEEKAERLAKFKSEFANYCNVDAMLFNYIFTELFLMVDNRAKNAFPTRYRDGKWLILPYDYDTAMGINNEGELKFGYDLEDTDLINDNNVFNGQDSVLYVNMRLAFADEIASMYKELRTSDVFSYEEIEKRFEEHQNVWGEAIFNEDAKFKYIDPLVNEGNNTYLPMVQGAKAEQRKWWLYNRFRYIDSKYNAGDSLTDYIMLRSYAVDDITVTPYADIYATAAFDSALVQKRALRGNTYTLENPLSGGRDAVIAIYSASQLLSIGDLSGLKVGMADFSKATKLSSLKLGDSTEDYDNPNLTDLTIGNLTLLSDLDVRNCSALAQSVDLSGCTNIEHVYFDGTAITGVKLPNGGILKTLHLPSTVSALTIQNQMQLRDFVMPSYENISTLRLEGVNKTVFDTLAMLNQIKPNARVRILGVDWTIGTTEEIFALYNKLDTFRGLDENGNNLDYPVISGTIHIGSIKSTDLQEMKRRYPNIDIKYNNITLTVDYVNDGVTIFSQEVAVGAPVPTISNPTKESTAQHNFTFLGWSLDGKTVTTIPMLMPNNGLRFIALYSEEIRCYTVRFFNDKTLLQTVENVPYGTDAVYTGAEPTKTDFAFIGWNPAPTNIAENTDCYAQFKSTKAITRALIDRTISEYSSDTLTSVGDYAFYSRSNLTSVNAPSVTNVGQYAFCQCSKLTSVNIPNVTSIDENAFSQCNLLASVNMSSVTSVLNSFGNCASLTSVNIPNVTRITGSAFYGCSKLTSVYLPATPPAVSGSSFNNINANCVFYVPTGSLAAYQTHSDWSAYTSKYSFVEEDR